MVCSKLSFDHLQKTQKFHLGLTVCSSSEMCFPRIELGSDTMNKLAEQCLVFLIMKVFIVLWYYICFFWCIKLHSSKPYLQAPKLQTYIIAYIFISPPRETSKVQPFCSKLLPTIYFQHTGLTSNTSPQVGQSVLQCPTCVKSHRRLQY